MNKTDEAWEAYGKLEPYYGVLTDPKFRLQNLTAQAVSEFFESGEQYIGGLLNKLERYRGAEAAADVAIDFGCGVGRLVIPLAKRFRRVIGIDISDSMLAETRKNAALSKLENVTTLKTVSEVSPTERVDFIHSFIVFQHIPEARGRVILKELLTRLKPGGVGAIHLNYHNPYEAHSARAGLWNWYSALNIKARAFLAGRTVCTGGDARKGMVMQMNPYHLNTWFVMLHRAGVANVTLEFTDAGGFLGVICLFRKELT